jgi:outer membrane protein assembly factor BamB
MVSVATFRTIGPPGAYYPATVSAVRATDGALVWKSGDVDARQSPMPLAGDGNVYAHVNGDGNSYNLVAYDAGSGSVRWHVAEAPVCPASLVAAGNGAVYYVTCDSHLVALSARNGTERWRIAVGNVGVRVSPTGGLRVSPTGGLYVISDGSVEALDPQSGAVLWQRAPENASPDLTFLQS